MTSSTYRVLGMTCDHCVSAVSSELEALDGVSDVVVELDPAGASAVTVTSARPLLPEELRAALDEAGDYRLADSR